MPVFALTRVGVCPDSHDETAFYSPPYTKDALGMLRYETIFWGVV